MTFNTFNNYDNFEKMYNLLDKIGERVHCIENSSTLYNFPTEYWCRDSRIGSIDIDKKSRIKFYSNISSSFVRDSKQENISTKLIYIPSSELIQVGHTLYKITEFSEEELFQLSLVYPDRVMIDLEFLLYLHSKKINYVFTLRYDAYSIEGLEYVLNSLNEVIINGDMNV